MRENRIIFTRDISPLITNCELTFVSRELIDFQKAQEQHRNYEERLKRLGANVIRLPHDGFADSVFIEDMAIVLPEIAIITRPGVATRAGETAAVAHALEKYRTLLQIEGPGTLEGGDVLRIGKNIFVGRSGRTNENGIAQLKALTEAHGYRVQDFATTECLHFKTAVTYLGNQTLLLNPQWIDPSRFADFEIIETDTAEPFGANSVLVDETVLYSSAFPKTRARLEHRGFRVETLDISEMQKAEAGLSCMSLILEG